jgi:hypothetical protein
MKLLSSLIICLALSACATDYASQLSEPGFGYRRLDYSEDNVDPAMLMNGIYASKQLNGPSLPLRAFCLNDYRCSPQSPLPSSGWDP